MDRSLRFLRLKRLSDILKPNLKEKWVENGASKNIVLCYQYNTSSNILVLRYKKFLTKISCRKMVNMSSLVFFVILITNTRKYSFLISTTAPSTETPLASGVTLVFDNYDQGRNRNTLIGITPTTKGTKNTEETKIQEPSSHKY